MRLMRAAAELTRGIVKWITHYCRQVPNAPILCKERRDRNEPDKLSGLPHCEWPAFPATFSAGLSLRFRGHFAVALRGLRAAVLRASDAVSDDALCALP